MIIGERLREARDKKGYSQIDFAKRVGISQQSLSRLENNKDRSSKKLSLIADILEVEEHWLDPDLPKKRTTNPTTSVPLVGYVGAGSETHFYEGADGPEEEVEAPPGSSKNTVAVEIRGTSLGPVFDGALVFYDQVDTAPMPELIKRLCVIGLENGQVLVKQLLKGSMPGHYHLMSSTEGMIENARIKWVAKVKAIVPR